jgi:hypothetical protein
MFGADPNASTAVFDCFDRVFDLEVAAIRGENRIGKVIARPYRGLQESCVSATERGQGFSSWSLP